MSGNVNYDKKEVDNFINNIYPQVCSNSRYIPAVIPAVERIVVFGDIHGDYELAVDMLIAAKVAEWKDNKFIWIGGNTYVVQVGDQVDRCRPTENKTCDDPLATIKDEASDIKILEMYTDMDEQARKDGGAVISLLGNHEIMNASGQLQYVSYAGLKQFNNYVDPKNPDLIFRSGADARRYAFAPGNQYGTYLGCNRLPAVIIGSNIFVHAGIVDGLIREIGLSGLNDFEAINVAIRKWLLGLLNRKHVSHIIGSSKYSMFWTRILGSIASDTPLSNPVCKDNISKVLNLFKVGGIIIGHTPQSFQFSKDLNATCDGIVWRVDNGSSQAFNLFDKKYINTGKRDSNRRVQYLEIVNDNIYKTCDMNSCKEYKKTND